MPLVPTIDAAVTFLGPDEGGRRQCAHDDDSYRPHVVVGDREQREAIYDDRGQSAEDYLGVEFSGDGRELPPGVAHNVTMRLTYHPQVDYDRLCVGATFTIREGRRIVGFGEVRARSGSNESGLR